MLFSRRFSSQLASGGTLAVSPKTVRSLKTERAVACSKASFRYKSVRRARFSNLLAGSSPPEGSLGVTVATCNQDLLRLPAGPTRFSIPVLLHSAQAMQLLKLNAAGVRHGGHRYASHIAGSRRAHPGKVGRGRSACGAFGQHHEGDRRVRQPAAGGGRNTSSAHGTERMGSSEHEPCRIRLTAILLP